MGNDSIKSAAWKHFGEYQVVFLATSQENQPLIRPVSLIHLDGDFFVSVKAKKAIVNQIRENPRTAFCLELGDLMTDRAGVGYVRVACDAEILDDEKLREELYNRLDFIRRLYDSLEDYHTRALTIKLKPVVIRYMAPDSWKEVKVELSNEV
jgi:general stress protein 26